MSSEWQNFFNLSKSANSSNFGTFARTHPITLEIYQIIEYVILNKNIKNYENLKSVVEMFFFSNYIFWQILSFQASFLQNLDFFLFYLLVWIQRSRLKFSKFKNFDFWEILFFFGFWTWPVPTNKFFSVCL